MRVGDDVLAAELEAALYHLNAAKRLRLAFELPQIEPARAILVRVIRVLRDRLEALA